MDELNIMSYYYFYSGYKDDKKVRIWDHFMVLCHVICAFAIAILLYKSLAQAIVIVVALILLLIVTIALRPWISGVLNIVEIIQ